MSPKIPLLLAAIIVLAFGCIGQVYGLSQGEAVYLGQHVDIGNVIGWSSAIAWNGGYAPPSAGSSPVVVKLPGSLEGKANYYIDPAVFGKYPGRWYKWDGGSFTSPKENTVVFNIGNLPEEPPASVVTAVPTVTVGPTPRVETQTPTTTESDGGFGLGYAALIIGGGLVLIVVVANIASPKEPTKVIYQYVDKEPEVVEKVIYKYIEPEPQPEPEPNSEPDDNGIYTAKPKREYINVETKEFVYTRAGYKCENCGYGNFDVLEIHHVLPVRHGGTNHPHNLKLLCPTCHRVMGKEYKDWSNE